MYYYIVVPAAFFKEIDRKLGSNVKWNTVSSSRANMFHREFMNVSREFTSFIGRI